MYFIWWDEKLGALLHSANSFLEKRNYLDQIFTLHIIESQNNIDQVAILIGDFNRLDTRTPGYQTDNCFVFIRQCIPVHVRNT